MASTQKDTIYIDVDDEITSIIEKLQNSSNKIVALVLPKRASVLQSIVNMKLLKRTADTSKKHVVLITSEASLLPLAGAVGLHVANSLNSKPAIPVAPDMVSRESVIDEETGEEFDDFNPDSVAGEPIGKLAGAGAAGAATGATAGTSAGLGAPASGSNLNEPETIELDNEDKPGTGTGINSKAPVAAGAAAAAINKGKNKKLKVPDFNKFRLLLVAGLLALLLLGGGFIYANTALAKAVITIRTNSSDYATKANLTLDPNVTEFDVETATLPAKLASKQQAGSQQVSTSGQKNNGTKATGRIMMTSQVCGGSIPDDSPPSVVSGTGVSSGNKTFITQQSTTFADSGVARGGCVTYQATNETDVTAQTAGADYNIVAGTFTVAGRSDVSGKSGSSFNGGTDNIVKVVTQADIDSAKAKIAGADSASVKDELSKKLQADGYAAIIGSLHAGEPVVSPSAAVGDQADTVTVTQSVPYTLYGARSSDIKKVIADSVERQIDPTKQQILNDGYAKAIYKVDTTAGGGPIQVSLTATSLAGPDIKTEALKSQLAGKKTGDVQAAIKNIPGVTDVTVKYSPFWVSSVPKSADKITITIVKASGNDAN